MFRKGLLVAGALLLGGCALPLPVQIASWAIDGLSVLTTEKTIADHGVSLVAQKDCALWRGFVEGSVCRDNDAVTVIALADLTPAASDVPVPADDGARLAAFETAAGGTVVASADTDAAESSDAPPANWRATVERLMDALPVAFPMAEPESAPTIDDDVLAVAPTWDDPAVVEDMALAESSVPTAEPVAPVDKGRATADASAMPEPAAIAPAPEQAYYVVGSFAQRANALAFADRYADLRPTILSARLDGQAMYRVAVGPFAPAEQKAMRGRLAGYGLADAWAIRFDSTTWSVITATGPPSTERVQLARASPGS
jgi:hypothetical protein